MRQRIILLSFALLGAFFLATVTLAKTYEARKAALVQEWAQEGDKTLAAGMPAVAIEDFRNALAYDPDNGPVQLHLAQALLTAGRLEEARIYFLNLWQATPGSGILNLELARISAQLGASDQAILYYRTAIVGGWDQQPELQRHDVRSELCRFLIMQGRTSDAIAEIEGLATDAPPADAQTHVQAGELFLKVGAPTRAFAEFELALKTKPEDAAIVEEAGQAAYQAANYEQAEKYLNRALRKNSSDDARKMLGTVRQIQENDPFRAELSDRDQAQRVHSAYLQAVARLGDCEKLLAGGSANQAPELADLSNEVRTLKPPVTQQFLQMDPEYRHQIMHMVFRIEDVSARHCDAPKGMDEALLLIGKKHAQTEQ